MSQHGAAHAFVCGGGLCVARACVFKRVCVICALMCNYLEFDVAVGEALDAVLPVLVGAQIDDVTIRVLVPGGEKK